MVIKKEGGEYVLYSHDGSRVLGHSDTLAGIKERERQVQYFKHAKGNGRSKSKKGYKKIAKPKRKGKKK